ncbi:MAG: AMP-binding protein [Planctomycetes bacterium]|nr:AMP-binding protein [Planctomycetota bacterium]
MFTAWRTVGLLSVQELRRLQFARLRRFLEEQVYPFSAFYRRLFDSHRLRPQHIQSLDDLRRIPFTQKSDFLPSDVNPEGYRSFVLQPSPENIRRHWPRSRQLPLLLRSWLFGKEGVRARLREEYQPIFMTATTGRSAEPVTFLYSKHDLGRLEVAGERLLEIFGVRFDDRVVNLFPYAPHLAFWQSVMAGFSKGVLVLSTGGGKVMGTPGNIRSILRMKPSLLLGVPGYVYHLLRTAYEEGHDFSFVKRVVLGAEKVTPGMKEKMVELLTRMGAEDVCILGTYGFTEARMAWGECVTDWRVSSGYHTYPDLEIFEVIDPGTGEPVGEGEGGEIVYTCLDSRASCVLRYRTGDQVKGGLRTGPCPHCGLTVPRLSSDITRISNVKELNTTKIRGTLVNLNVFSEILSEEKEIDEWQVEIHKRNNDPYELDELVLNISVRDGMRTEMVESQLRRRLQDATELTPNRINVLPLHDMLLKLGMETELKEKRILDLRPKN